MSELGFVTACDESAAMATNVRATRFSGTQGIEQKWDALSGNKVPATTDTRDCKNVLDS